MKSSDLKKQQTCLFKEDSFAEIWGLRVSGARFKWHPTWEGADGVNGFTKTKASGCECMLNRKLPP